jgi:hypothetical protein|tara:strand:+ start:75 stop:416 length:342 start_codon:yes stop_codon:yes gene_type:complete
MAAIELTGKEIYSRVLQAVPGVSQNYVLNLINEALVDMGMHQQKMENAKTTLLDNKLWYDLDDNQNITINKVFRCSIKNSDGEYIDIPRLTPGKIKRFYNETSVSDKFVWTEV